MDSYDEGRVTYPTQYRTAAGTAGDWQRGIAYGADLWSGAIASSWNGPPWPTRLMNFTPQTFQPVIYKEMVTGVGGKTADVVNASWGFSSVRDNSAPYGKVMDARVTGSAGPAFDAAALRAAEPARPLAVLQAAPQGETASLAEANEIRTRLKGTLLGEATAPPEGGWVYGPVTVQYVKASERTSINRKKLVQNGVSLDQILKSMDVTPMPTTIRVVRTKESE